MGTAWPRLEKRAPIKLLCAPLTVPLAQPRGRQLVSLAWLAPGSSNASPLYPAGNIPQPHAVPLSSGSRGQAVPGSQTELLSWAQTHPCAAPVPHMCPQAGAQGWRGTHQYQPCPAGPVLCLTCNPGACGTPQLPTILGSGLACALCCCCPGWVVLPEPQTGTEVHAPSTA